MTIKCTKCKIELFEKDIVDSDAEHGIDKLTHGSYSWTKPISYTYRCPKCYKTKKVTV